MWTDAFQTVTMFGSFLAVVIKGNIDAGGSAKVFKENYDTGRVQFFE